MMDHLYIGSVPADEPCAQTGITAEAGRFNRAECNAYITALRKVYGPEPDGCAYHIKRESHDFGAYYEVVIYFEENDEAATAYAYKVEAGLATWAEADMVAPVQYDENSQPIGIAA